MKALIAVELCAKNENNPLSVFIYAESKDVETVEDIMTLKEAIYESLNIKAGHVMLRSHSSARFKLSTVISHNQGVFTAFICELFMRFACPMFVQVCLSYVFAGLPLNNMK